MEIINYCLQQIHNGVFWQDLFYIFIIFVLIACLIACWLRKQKNPGAAFDDDRKVWEEVRRRVQRFPSPTGKRFGLALSGGGIRSATFSLGVLQALAVKGKLASFDYLSTVSGGGYIGSWLSAWIQRTSLFHVQTELARVGSRNGIPPDTDEPPEVIWLRKYSNYLAPRLGLFSADSLTLVTTWLRNVFLNLIILIAFVATLLLVPRLLLKPTQWAFQIRDCYGIVAAFLSICCIYLIGLNIDRDAKKTWRVGQAAQGPWDVCVWWWLTTKSVYIILLLAIFTAIFGSIWLFSVDQFNAATIYSRFGWLLLFVECAWFIAGIRYNLSIDASGEEGANQLPNRCDPGHDRRSGHSNLQESQPAKVDSDAKEGAGQNDDQGRDPQSPRQCEYALIYAIGAIIGFFFPVIAKQSWAEVFWIFWVLTSGVYLLFLVRARSLGVGATIAITLLNYVIVFLPTYAIVFYSEAISTTVMLAGLLILLVVWCIAWGWWRFRKPRDPTWWVQWLCWDAFIYAGAAVFTVALAVGCAWWVRHYVGRPLSYPDFFAALLYPNFLATLLTFGPSGFMVAFGVCGWIFMGLVGRTYLEPSREWWSRMNAWFLTLGLGWFSLCALAFYSSAFLEWVYGSIPTWAGVIGSGWIGSLLATLLVPKPAGLSITKSAYFDRALNVAAAFSVVGLLLLLAVLVHWSLMKGAGLEPELVEPAKTVSELHLQLGSGGSQVTSDIVTKEATASFKAYRDARIKDLANLATAQRSFLWMDYFFSAFVCVLFVLVVFCWRVDINTFSLHNMYKNRLIRCYLGASNPKRRQQPFTGFDDGDDIRLADLWNQGKYGLVQRSYHINQGKYGLVQRPYHILNATLNISQGRNLAWQERKAASFIFSSHLCGYWLSRTQGHSSRKDENCMPPARYQETDNYATEDFEAKGFTLGMAMATSSAAVSPNMGRATQPMRAFLLTLFDLRLGRWSPNPALKNAKKPGPPFALWYLLLELFGLANEDSKFVYLSDGGHFENLGLYELVRLGLDVIMVVDAGEDRNRRFGDIAEAVRKCRVDFGVEITLKLDPLRTSSDDHLSKEGFTEGEIKYGNGKVGKLILIKPSLRKEKNEPADVLEYAQRYPDFPQQTTTDQFFDESQFESYRQLGLFIGTRYLKEHPGVLPTVTVFKKR